jgi:putative oxidoreductase
VGHLVHTDGDRVSLGLRLALAAVIFPHGAQKLLGWFGGYGFSGTMGFFTEQLGLPGLLAFLVIFIEFFGALALAAGVLGRAAAAGIAAVMIGAVVTTHLPNGFFMNWSGTQSGEGFEFHLLAVGIAAALVIKGSGAASVDRWWTEERLAA